MRKATNTIKERQDKEKALLLANLKKMPIVHIACEKSGIGRATYYRWREEDEAFRKAADEALTEGEALITDMSESQLISLIKERKFPAVHLWLRHHHPKYGDKIEVIQSTKEEGPLTPDQQQTIRQALRRSRLITLKTHHEEGNREPAK